MEAEFTNLNIRIDKKVKQQADLIFDEMGINLSTAVNIFVRQVIKNKGIPFRISTKEDENPLNLDKEDERLPSLASTATQKDAAKNFLSLV